MYKNNPSIPAPEQRNRKSERDHPDKRRSFLSVARCNFLAGDGIRINFTVTQFPRDFWHALSDPRPKSPEISRRSPGVSIKKRADVVIYGAKFCQFSKESRRARFGEARAWQVSFPWLGKFEGLGLPRAI